MLKYFSYWCLPILSAIIWWGMLIALLVYWCADGRPVYPWMDDGQTFPYISHVAATKVQGVFISCAAAQGLLFVLAMAAERYLRHAGRLPKNLRRREKIMSGFAIAWSIIGELGILFVSIFNTVSFKYVHEAFLGVFIICIGISTVCNWIEYFYLDKNNKDVARIRWSTCLKVPWFFIALGIVIGFLACQKGYGKKLDASAALEWTISFWYPFYSLILAYDLLPALNTPKHTYTLGPSMIEHSTSEMTEIKEASIV